MMIYNAQGMIQMISLIEVEQVIKTEMKRHRTDGTTLAALAKVCETLGLNSSIPTED